jgi:hypothetical protein
VHVEPAAALVEAHIVDIVGSTRSGAGHVLRIALVVDDVVAFASLAHEVVVLHLQLVVLLLLEAQRLRDDAVTLADLCNIRADVKQLYIPSLLRCREQSAL